MQVRSLASLSELRIQCCCELWCRSKTWLGPGIAVAVAQASSYSSDEIPAWEPPYAAGVALKRQKEKRGKKIKKKKERELLKSFEKEIDTL